jgi:hypothetical protein
MLGSKRPVRHRRVFFSIAGGTESDVDYPRAYGAGVLSCGVQVNGLRLNELRGNATCIGVRLQSCCRHRNSGLVCIPASRATSESWLQRRRNDPLLLRTRASRASLHRRDHLNLRLGHRASARISPRTSLHAKSKPRRGDRHRRDTLNRKKFLYNSVDPQVYFADVPWIQLLAGARSRSVMISSDICRCTSM